MVGLMVVAAYPRYDKDRLGFVIELLLCLAIGCVGRWPLPASLVSGVLMTSLLVDPVEMSRPSLLAVPIVIGSAAARGSRLLAGGMTIWYLLVTGLNELNPVPKLEKWVTAELGWISFALVGLAIGVGAHRISAVQEQGSVDKTAAVQAQRRSIARDLHDTVAYSTTSIILRAEQAKLRGVSDPRLAADLDYIIAAGRNSMRDLRGMMETLRRNDPLQSDPTSHSPWQISSLEETLADRVAELRAHGFVVTQHVDADLRSLPESVRETLAKIVVEVTSNMVKHGDPSGPCSIMVEGADDEIEAVFINRPRSAPLGTEGAQLGLVGARERVEALGGEVDVTSKSPTWVVRVRIPLGERA